MRTAHEDFKRIVKHSWETDVGAASMYKVLIKMQILKKALKDWNINIFVNVVSKMQQVEDEGRRLSILKLKSSSGALLNSIDDICKEAAGYFEALFTSSGNVIHNDILACIPTIVTSQMNEDLLCPLTIEEVKAAADSIPQDSAPGPDGFSGSFFSSCRDVIGNDIFAAANDFLAGGPLPRAFQCTLICLIPKKSNPEHIGDFRPISLCNIIVKIFSKVIASRLAVHLPTIISDEQGTFVRGRSIAENISTVREMVHDLDRRVFRGNLIIKLDMEKAYDRVEWDFLDIMLKKFGFDQHWINQVQRCWYGSWFFVLINGKAFGSFQSSRGLRQGDPFSPSMFIIAVEFLSRGLTNLFTSGTCQPFKFSRNSPLVSHLLTPKNPPSLFQRQPQELNPSLIQKILRRIEGWKSKLLNPAVKAILIKNVLSSIPIHILSALNIPAAVSNSLEADFADFFWGTAEGRQKKHWTKWARICRPLFEGGLGIRRLGDVMRAFSIKMGWSLLKGKSLWARLISAKYLPFLLQSKGRSSQAASQVWKEMLNMLSFAIQHSKWLIGEGKVNFWNQNWTGRGLLAAATLSPIPPQLRDALVRDFHPSSGSWNLSHVRPLLPPPIFQMLKSNPAELSDREDVLAWDLSTSSAFTLKSAWNGLRIHYPRLAWTKWAWNKALPPKIGALLWKIIHNAIPVDSAIQKSGISLASSCECCRAPHVSAAPTPTLSGFAPLSIQLLLASPASSNHFVKDLDPLFCHGKSAMKV
ncbi:uncharacterized protein LOC131239131 [Magnolia sinica]|uniref:uncharacterized protein LOC131239131 n=1 Tax=Magnolia sinica TaxID=86752 RepID=UPI0026589470|nr:uncharacterized protein LOC131239131 [Magnolia sinica]